MAERAVWQIDGPAFNSFEDGDPMQDGKGYLGVDYTTGVDCRWPGQAMLGPQINTLDFSAVGGTTANTNGVATSGSMNASSFAYFTRGTIPAKVNLSDMTVTAGPTLAEAATGVLYTKTATGTQEVTFFMLASGWRTVSVVATPPTADTSAVNTGANIARIGAYAYPADRVALLSGQTVNNVILTGTTTMGVPTVTNVSTIAGKEVVPTGFVMDANFWIIGTDRGPYMLDSDFRQFRALIDEQGKNAVNCVNAKVYTPMGAMIPLAKSTRANRFGQGRSVGPEAFLTNTSPIQGYCTALAPTDRWLYWAHYNPVTGDSYLLAARPRQQGDPGVGPMSFYPLAVFSATQVNIIDDLDVEGGRTNPTLVGGQGTNGWWMTQGRVEREIDDTNYRYALSGSLYLTELQRSPHSWKNIEYVEFETAGCTAARTITVYLIGVDRYGNSSTLQVGAPVVTNGMQRVYIPRDGNFNGAWRFKLRVDFVSDSATASPSLTGGGLTVGYELVPMRLDDRYAKGEGPG